MLVCVIWFCLLVPQPGQSEDAGRQMTKKKRKKPRKQAEKVNTPSVKQTVSNTSKPAPGQRAAPQVNKASPDSAAQSRSESLVTGEKASIAIVRLKCPELRWLLFSCFTHM